MRRDGRLLRRLLRLVRRLACLCRLSFLLERFRRADLRLGDLALEVHRTSAVIALERLHRTLLLGEDLRLRRRGFRVRRLHRVEPIRRVTQRIRPAVIIPQLALGELRGECIAFRLERGWYSFDTGGFRFIVLDTSWAEVNGRFVHYGRDCGFVQWKLPQGAGMRLHPDEFPFLEESLDSAPGVCIVASHRSLFGDDPDAQRVRAIFAAANRAQPGRVTLALNGHNHCDLLRVREGVSYYTVNSPNHCWIPLKHTAYPTEDMRRWTGIDHIVAYDGTPLSAIVTLTPDGRFSVKGMSGGFWRDVQPAQISPKFANLTASIKDRT